MKTPTPITELQAKALILRWCRDPHTVATGPIVRAYGVPCMRGTNNVDEPCQVVDVANGTVYATGQTWIEVAERLFFDNERRA